MECCLEHAQIIIQTSAIIIGGLWAFWRFVLQRESHAKIEFDLNIDIIGFQDNNYLVELTAIITNKGGVRHKIRDFKFSLFTLSENDSVHLGDNKINNQVIFTKIGDSKPWVPNTYNYTFIDAGVTQKYRHITCLPKNTTCILLQSKFIYPDRKSDFHSAQKTFTIKKQE